MYSHHIMNIIIVLGAAVIMPITIVFLSLRQKMESEKNKKEIILAALEKNTGIDIKELVRKMNAPEKLLKEKLLEKLQIGLVSSLIGVGLIVAAGCLGYIGGSNPGEIFWTGIGGSVLLAVGLAFIISYAVGRKLLAKEMEAEEKNLRQA